MKFPARSKWLVLPAVAISLLGAAYALARNSRSEADIASSDLLLDGLRPELTVEQYIASVVGAIRRADKNQDGLDEGDIALERNRQNAQRRAQQASQILLYDLDGDLVATEDEIRQLSDGNDEIAQRGLIDRLMDQHDRNGDRSITIEEAIVLSPRFDRQDLAELLTLDPDGDGKLSASELTAVAEKTFASVDRDGSGTISRSEYEAVQERIEVVRAMRRVTGCALPKAPEKAQIIAYSGYEADAISSTVIGGSGQETNYIEVIIEPGKAPLYLLLASYESMVWHINDTTGRVVMAAVSSTQQADPATVRQTPASKPAQSGHMDRARALVPPPGPALQQVSASGVVGLSAEKVKVLPTNCLRAAYKADSRERSEFDARVRYALGREPDAHFGSYSAQTVSLPSGKIAEARAGHRSPKGFDPEMWREAVRYWPGGLAQVRPSEVVSPARAEPYKVLPSQMGLAQLIGSGAVERIDRDEFRILKKIPRLPPSMGGAHSVTLYIARGVELPPGDPVHSCVIREITGLPVIDGARCRNR